MIRDSNIIQWKYTDDERPQGCCYDCRTPYHAFQDMIIPDKYWDKINPTYHDGAGLLCPTCIINRLHMLGLWYDTLQICEVIEDD